MKYFLFILFICIRITGFTQSTINFAAGKPSDKLKKILIETMYDFSNAWGKSDTVTLTKLLAPEYRHTDIFGKLQHKKEWLAFAAIKREVADLKISDIEILIYSGNIAAVTGRMNYLFGTEKTEQELRFTQILRNYKGLWKRIIFQATLIKK